MTEEVGNQLLTVAKRGSWLSSLLRLSVATVLHGLASGLVGVFVAELIFLCQKVAYGADDETAKGGFRMIAESAPEWRRFLAVLFGGVIGAVGWFWLRGVDPAIVSVDASMKKGAKMPPVMTLLNAMLQDIVVAFGGSFGREAAPREIAAMIGGTIADAFRLEPKDRRTLVACGTGAGLAAVYSVPMSGVFYTLEHILEWDLSPRVALPAILTSCLATYVTAVTGMVDTDGLYNMQLFSYRPPTRYRMFWAVAIGPIAGVAAAGFQRLIIFVRAFRPKGRRSVAFVDAPVGHHVRLIVQLGDGVLRGHKMLVESKSTDIVVCCEEVNGERQTIEFDVEAWEAAKAEGRRDWDILVGMPASFLALALLCVHYPTLLGNGRALAHDAIFSGKETEEVRTLMMLFFLKAILTSAAIGSGADGGTLTPSVALGATLGAVLHTGLDRVWPMPLHRPAIATISAAAFLSAILKAPVTGSLLMMEFTGQAIRREDLEQLIFRGDPAGVLHSNLAVGMLLPIAVAVFLSGRSFRWAMRPVKRPGTAPAPATMLSSGSQRGMGHDLDIGHEFDNEGIELDVSTKEAIFNRFRRGLLLNTSITLCSATYLWQLGDKHGIVGVISLAGVALATTMEIAVWLRRGCQLNKPLTIEEPLLAFAAVGRRRRLRAVSLTSLWAALGAAAPLTPWALRIYKFEHGWELALASSVLCATAAEAACASLDVKKSYGALLAAPHTGQRSHFVRRKVFETLMFATVAILAGAGAAMARKQFDQGPIS